MDVPLPWERLLWSGRPAYPTGLRAVGVRYLITDFRIVRLDGAHVDELALHDLGDIHRNQSRLDRLIGTSTLVLQPRSRRPSAGSSRIARGEHERAPIVLQAVRHGAQVAGLLELLAGDPRVRVDAEAVAAAIAWEPHESSVREALAGLAAVAIAVVCVAVSLHGTPAAVTYSSDDAIYPDGQKKDREAIVRFMRDEVMPWARMALAPIVHGAERVRCETCHGAAGEARGWSMPGVSVLPTPDVKERGWERYGGWMDAQMRNAIYGYAAESNKQTKAAYMREIVMPGMARMLHRQPYDFTKPYAYNRSRAAFGCYHCHKVK